MPKSPCPDGQTRDRKTGNCRPKKSPGRPRKNTSPKVRKASPKVRKASPKVRKASPKANPKKKEKCKPDEEPHPNEPSRCLKRCKDGTQRNLETMRCKKIEKKSNSKRVKAPEVKAPEVKAPDGDIPLPLLLPKKLSVLTPLKIAEIIVKEIRTIEGPYYADIMIPNSKLYKELGRDGPVLLLLSDEHTSNNKCDTACVRSKGCYSLYRPSYFMKFIDHLSEIYSISTDIFLETWFTEELRKDYKKAVAVDQYQYKNMSALLELIQDLKPCMSHKRNLCNLPHVRTHMSDTRKIAIKKGDKYLADSILEPFMKKGITIENVEKQWKEEFPEFSLKEICDYIRRLISNDDIVDTYFDEPIIQKYSRTYHEWNQLPTSIKNNLLKYAKSTYKTRYSNFNYTNLEKLIINFLLDTILENDIQGFNRALKQVTAFISRGTGPLNMFIIDMYTISRSLKNVKPPGLPSQLSVIYLGGWHIDVIRFIIKDYYSSFRKYGVNIVSQNKCITINP